MHRCIALTTMTLCLMTALPASTALAQMAKDVVGTYTFVSAVVTQQDGSRVEPFGPNPKGLYVFDSSGRFAFVLLRSDLPKFAANNRLQGTPEENKAVVQGSIAGFGSYSIADKVLTLKFEGSTYPNWIGTDVKQNLISFTGDDLKWSLAASGGGTAEVTLKRLN